MSKKKKREHKGWRYYVQVGGRRMELTGEDGKYYHTAAGSFRKLREDVIVFAEPCIDNEGDT